MFDVQTEKFF